MAAEEIDLEIDRREGLQLFAALLGGAAGVLAGKTATQQTQPLLPGGEEPTLESFADGHFVIAESYELALEEIVEPAIAFTVDGTTWAFGEGKTRFTMSGVEILTGYESYSAAKQDVDVYPTIVFTTDGSSFVFDGE